ncbi:MAG TPA: hypothetical protein VNU26_08495, partial [Mycobacteriales bacterium]|nr:hypothetical protein [Mycobacteriales bacterium]
MSALAQALRDGAVVTWRNLVGLRRVPDALLALTVQPIMFVVLFALVFAGSLGGEHQREQHHEHDRLHGEREQGV